MTDVIAIFDIGKTNKKLLLFDSSLKLVFQSEIVFDEGIDDDGFPCDDVVMIETWIQETIAGVLKDGQYNVKAINFSGYGASLIYIDEEGNRIGPLYNYLKPMPDGVLNGFYDRYGGVDEFCRATASPALGMLNSGLQIIWIKHNKPALFQKVKSIVHFPQYMSFLFTNKIVSEYTSIGCHTALWDFAKNRYHEWLTDEKILLPDPVANSTVYNSCIEKGTVKAGVGIHDSSASLVPYLMKSDEPFTLISTGTWCIFMNPFNVEPLTAEQLQHDTLCYLSINQQQVKSSRLFLGHIHNVNTERLCAYFNIAADEYKKVQANDDTIRQLLGGSGHRLFFENGLPSGYVDTTVDLSVFKNFEDAYHKLICDLVDLCLESYILIIPENDQSRVVFITGGFSRNEIFLQFMAARLPHKRVYTSQIDNSSAFGAMLVIYEKTFGLPLPEIDLGIKEVRVRNLF